ncbi:hypothetical protein HOD61_00845 [archaeon]|jgi:hypothetical protein|nr:hypothetical protein [archaeon]
MKYKINEKQSFIEITQCETSEVKRWLESLEKVIPISPPLEEIEEELINLENIITPEEFNFSRVERVYYNKDSILYVANVTFEQRPFYFPIMKKHFEAAKEVFEKDY